MTCDKCGNPIESGTRCDGCKRLLADLKDEDDE
jgi:methionyl-tRNA synthetase